jgi:hypothetical protein
MKNLVWTLVMLIIAGHTVLGQSEYEIPVKQTKTLLGDGTKVRGFGSLDMRMTELTDDLGLLMGAHGGIILNNHFVIGLGGYGLTSNFQVEGSESPEDLYLYGGYGGLILGGIFSPKEVVHIYTPVLIGAGGMEVTDRNYLNNFHRPYPPFGTFAETSAFFMVEPGLDVEINVTRFFKIGLGASYRLVRQSDLITVSDKDLSGFSGGLSLKFGKF